MLSFPTIAFKVNMLIMDFRNYYYLMMKKMKSAMNLDAFNSNLFQLLARINSEERKLSFMEN